MKVRDAGVTLLAALLLALVLPSAVGAQARTLVLKPSYLPPAELASLLGARDGAVGSAIEWGGGGDRHLVDVRRNDAANQLVLIGSADDLAMLESLAKTFDVAPKQIRLEAKVIEIDTDRAKSLGFDWNVFANGQLSGSAITQNVHEDRSQSPGPFSSFSQTAHSNLQQALAQANSNIQAALSMLETAGAATFRDAPSVITLNNRPATVLDGTRAAYVSRSSGYTNLYAVDTLDAGLRLEATPSLGEGGLLRIRLITELTQLASAQGNPISGAFKTGQIVDNTIVARDGETIVLGGFTHSSEQKTTRRLPGLGRVLPFLFSRETTSVSHRESLIALTAHVVDPSAPSPMDEGTKKLLEGR